MFYYNMSAVNLNGQNITVISPEIKNRLESNENFSALDREKLKQDTAEFASQQAEEVKKENFVYRIMRNLGVKEPKKFLKSLGLTIVTIVGLAYFGNKMSTKTAEWGIKVDKFLQDKTWYQNLTKNLNSFKAGVKNFLSKSETLRDVGNVLKKENMEKPTINIARGYGRGPVGIFSYTPIDILRKTFEGKNADEVEKSLEAIVGKDKAHDFAQKILGEIVDNQEFCSDLSKAIAENFGAGDSKEKLLEVLKGLEKGNIAGKTEGLDAFRNIVMKDKYNPPRGPLRFLSPDFYINSIGKLIAGDKWEPFSLLSLMGDWWPTNLVNKAGRKIRGDKWKDICRGNLGDSLIKFNAVNGTLADTALGKLVQSSITVPTESISNFVNDKAGAGILVSLSTIGLFNSLQDTPKGKKAATVADDFVGTLGSIIISTPLAFKTTYALASLANLEGKTFLSKILKVFGKFFDMGKSAESGPLAGKVGALIRFVSIMFVFSSIFRKPITKLTHKIFGEPYNKAEEERKKQIEEQQNAIIPELGISNKELMEKIQANPEALQKIQNNPILARQIADEPKLLLDILDGKEVQPKQLELSPANKKLIEQSKKIDTSANLFSNKKQEPKNEKRIIDTATYIPSSEAIVPETMNESRASEYNKLMYGADRALRNAEKYLR